MMAKERPRNNASNNATRRGTTILEIVVCWGTIIIDLLLTHSFPVTLKHFSSVQLKFVHTVAENQKSEMV